MRVFITRPAFLAYALAGLVRVSVGRAAESVPFGTIGQASANLPAVTQFTD